MMKTRTIAYLGMWLAFFAGCSVINAPEDIIAISGDGDGDMGGNPGDGDGDGDGDTGVRLVTATQAALKVMATVTPAACLVTVTATQAACLATVMATCRRHRRRDS